MAPGQYELLATGPGAAGYQTVTVDRDLDLRIALGPLPTVQFVVEDTDGRPFDPAPLKVMARRKDIAGDSKAEVLELNGGEHAALLPGRWDMALDPGLDYYVSAVTPGRGRADGWNEILLMPASQNVVKFVLSATPAKITGTVRNGDGNPVAGIPVFLEPYDLEPARRLAEVRATHADAKGEYSFRGLAPGTYRLLASFEYQMPDAAEMETAATKTEKLEDGAKAVADLEEFVIH